MKVRIPNSGQSNQAMLRQVQEIQKNMTALQEDLEQREYTATAGGGMVEA
ncbi:MAG: YbaB/EbfC family nucleoid-associated protein, partial [Clostridia bacterium]|nr:YbaB/EbfC family nucleoid-associated protein [Clostridia bacterium]